MNKTPTILLMALLAAASRSPSDTLQLRKLEMVDSAGRKRIVMQVLDDGAAGLIIIDPDTGAPRLSIAVDQEGIPSFVIQDREGAKRASLMMVREGEAGLAIFDDRGTRSVLSSNETGSDVGLRFFDREGRTRARAGIEEDGSAALRLAYGDSDGIVLRAADSSERLERVSLLTVSAPESTIVAGAGRNAAVQLRSPSSRAALTATSDEALVSFSQGKTSVAVGVERGKKLR